MTSQVAKMSNVTVCTIAELLTHSNVLYKRQCWHLEMCSTYPSKPCCMGGAATLFVRDALLPPLYRGSCQRSLDDTDMTQEIAKASRTYYSAKPRCWLESYAGADIHSMKRPCGQLRGLAQSLIHPQADLSLHDEICKVAAL